MDRRERIADPLISLQAHTSGFQGKIWTALPGIMQSFDAAKMTCVVQPAIQAQTRDPAGKWTNVTLPLCTDVPLQIPRGGGYGCTFPFASGQEGILLFSSRCIDAWWQSGGVQPQLDYRMHDLSDGMFVPGICSVKNAPASYSSTTARFWSEDGSQYVELDKSGGVVTVKASNTINLIAPTTHIQGAVVIDGVVSGTVGGGGTINLGNANIETTGNVTQGTVNLGTHHHTGVTTGGGNTGGPV